MQIVDLSTYAPEFEIKIDKMAVEVGQELRNSTISVSINERVGNASELTLIVADKFDVQKQNFIWLEKFLSKDSPLYDSEKKITVSIGYAKELKTMIIAKLKLISTSGFSNDITRLTLTGYDTSHELLTKMSVGKSEKGIEIEKNDTYSKIAEKIARSAKLGSKVHTTKDYRPITIKKNIAYIDFLKNAAKRVGYDFFISRGILFFIDPRIAEEQENNFVFKWNENLKEFIPKIDFSKIASEVEFRGYAADSRKLTVVRAPTGDEDVVEKGNKTGSQLAKELGIEKTVITEINCDTVEEMSDVTKARLNILSDKIITASCSTVGEPNLFPGQYVTVEGVGEHLTGKYYVMDVTHTIDGSGYTTKFNLSKNNIKI
jgi:phage protein D